MVLKEPLYFSVSCNIPRYPTIFLVSPTPSTKHNSIMHNIYSCQCEQPDSKPKRKKRRRQSIHLLRYPTNACCSLRFGSLQ